MPIIRWNPWNIDRLLDEDWDIPTIPGLSRLAGQGLNLYETEDSLIAEAAVPGIPEDRIDITIDENVVRINGSAEEKKEERDKRRYFMSSMTSSFNYSFRLPQGIVSDKEPTVEYDRGVIRLIFSKIEKKPPKKIAVSAKGKESKSSK